MTNIIASTFQYIKKDYPNVYMLTIASLISLWFRHFTQITAHYLPQYNLTFNMVFVVFVTWLLWIGDGSVSELYKYDNAPIVLSGSTNSTPDDYARMPKRY
jgi:hypothetical protein